MYHGNAFTLFLLPYNVIISLPFDVEKSIEAAALFEGKHDYKSLVKRSKVIHEDLLITEGNVDTIWMTPGRGLMTECLDPLYKNILFYDYWFKAPAFLRQQVEIFNDVVLTCILHN